MENLNVKAACKSAGIVSGVTYVACGFFYWILPEKTVGFFNYLFHGIDFNLVRKENIGFFGFVIGLIIAVLGTMAITYAFVKLYNKFSGR